MNLGIQVYLAYLLVFVSACDRAPVTYEEGIASYYADFFQDQLTASGVPYDSASLSAAHRTLPFGTVVRITNLSNAKQVTLTINDRGPFVENRIIDVSKAAALELNFIREGITKVQIEIVETTKKR